MTRSNYCTKLMQTVFVVLITASQTMAQKVDWLYADTQTNASFRGLCVVDDSVAWVSGSKGTVGVTTNGGRNWSFCLLKGYERYDFRSLYAFDAKHAVIGNAGAPACLLVTEDGGHNWVKVYEHKDTSAFIDGICFWDKKHGIAYGDPIGNRLLILNTNDGGKTWAERTSNECPEMTTGEASFAASGTCIQCAGKGTVYIATGGAVSRLLVSKNGGETWQSIHTPILQGTASRGIFSLLPLSKKKWIIAGGDYTQDSLRTDNLFYTNDGGKTWSQPSKTTRGYRECITAVDGALIAVGPGGFDICYDDGGKWLPLADERQYHVIKKSRKGNLVVTAGGGGKLSVLKISENK